MELSFDDDDLYGPFEEDLLDDIEYFGTYLTTEIVNYIANESNKYALSQNKVLGTNQEEICKFLGILLKMGITGLPRFDLYWTREYIVNGTADLISRNRFRTL